MGMFVFVYRIIVIIIISLLKANAVEIAKRRSVFFFCEM